MVVPSELIATLDTRLFTPFVCPSSLDFSCPETRSHTLGRVGGSGFRIHIFNLTDAKQLPGSSHDSPDRLVLRAGDDGPAIRADSHARHIAGVSLQNGLDLTGVGIPHPGPKQEVTICNTDEANLIYKGAQLT